MLTSLPSRRFLALGAVVSVLAVGACDDDDENGPDNEVQVSAMVIDAGTQVVTVDETGAVTPGPFVFDQGDRAVTVSFRDENGDLIDADDLIGYIAEATTNDADVVSVTPTGDFTFTITGEGAGTTTVDFSLHHDIENHDDFGPFPVSITIGGGGGS